MSPREVLDLRNQGNLEEAYEAARKLYATDKGPDASLAMFWTAVDVLKKRSYTGHGEEARKIFLALERLLPNVPDKEGWVANAFTRCQELQKKLEMRDSETKPFPIQTQMGRWGEDVAARYLYGEGYEIVERNWHSEHRDIDIIAQRGPLIVFVEVKTRRNCDYGEPQEAIDDVKRRHLQRAINHYVRSRKIEKFRFDIITVVGNLGTPSPEITHIEDVNLMELVTHRCRRKRY